jgi:hypothetical protein
MTTFSLSCLRDAENRGELILAELLRQIEMQFGVEFPADDQPLEAYLSIVDVARFGAIVQRIFPFVGNLPPLARKSLKDVQFDIQQRCTNELFA